MIRTSNAARKSNKKPACVNLTVYKIGVALTHIIPSIQCLGDTIFHNRFIKGCIKVGWEVIKSEPSVRIAKRAAR
jgi:hypothetical protein